jgi:sigma54-dependent transcription regulator
MRAFRDANLLFTEIVEEEITRLTASWASIEAPASDETLSGLLNRGQLAQMDFFDRAIGRCRSHLTTRSPIALFSIMMNLENNGSASFHGARR